MIRARFVGVAAVGLLAIQASIATAENPVFNGGFSRDLRGWSKETVPVAWSDRDAEGLADSGSAVVVQNGRAMNGEGIIQCLYGFTFTPGTAMSIGAKIHLPLGQAVVGKAAVGLNWYPESGCRGETLSAGGPRAEVSSPNDAFEWASVPFTVPDGAVSAELVAYVTKMEEVEAALLAYFDAIFVKPAGAPNPVPAIFIPAAAHVLGEAGTAWRTDVVVQNPTGATVQTYLYLLERGKANLSPAAASFSVPAGGTTSWGDVLAAWFAYDGAGALRLEPFAGTLLIGSRTYNLTAEGTYGQFVPGIPEGEATVFGQVARLIQLSESATRTAGYRTNIGLVSAVGMPIKVHIGLYTSGGSLLGTRVETVPAFAFMQFDRIFTEFTSADVENGYAVLSTSTPGGRFIAYASVIDNRTGDPICVQPSQI